MDDCEILVLEDEALIAIDIEMTLETAGHKNIAVCHTIEAAMAQIEQSHPKVALLDLNLGLGKTSVPVAERLQQVNIPFIFLSGYTESTVPLPSGLKDANRLAKPFESAQLVAEVQNVLDGS